MSHTILVTAPRLADAGREVLERAGCHLLFIPEGEEDRLGEIMASEPIDAVIARTLTLDKEPIASCKSLRAISRHGVGHDAVDIQAAAELGIPVTVVSDTNAQSVAELAIGLMIAVARNVSELDQRVSAGEWPRHPPGLQLSGRVLGLVGCGTIARLVAQMADAMGMRVIAYDPGLETMPDGISKAAHLGDLLTRCDVLSLHCPLLPSTQNLIDASALSTLHSSAIVINTARGGLIDEQALADAILAGHLRGAGLDTLNIEPPPESHPLLRLPQVVLTPHVGGNSDAALALTARAAAENALALLAGQPPTHGRIVNEHLRETNQ